MQAKADLHIHTTASDGKANPEELVCRAESSNLSVISITDHDTIAGVRAAQKEAERRLIEVMPGAEITGSFKKRDCHLLAYHFDLTDDGINALLKHHQKIRVQRAARILDQLRKKGISVGLDETRAETPGHSLGRPHIARMLQKKGYVASVKEAFMRYLNDKELEDTNSEFQKSEDVIKTVHQAGGAVVVAHPGRLYNSEEMGQLIEQGIDGIEAVHPSHHSKMKAELKDLAAKHELLITGGSDFHGKAEEALSRLGTHTVDSYRVTKIKEFCSGFRELTANV
jgi:predicted metal-dependent phosphoesterase TrpH